MAEILIQRRRHRSVWPWLLGLLALALLPLPFMAADRDDRPTIRRAAARRDTTTRRDTTPRADTVAEPIGPASATSGGAPTDRERILRARSGAAAAAPSTDRTTATAAGTVAPAPALTPGPPVTSGPPATAEPSARGPSASPAPSVPGASLAPRSAAAPPSSGSAAARSTFEGFIATRKPSASDREHRQFTAEALRRLADELRALGASTSGVRAIRANADSLLVDRVRRNGHPDYARAAFLAAVRELDVLRARHAAPVDTGRLRAAAWAIRADQRLQAQQTVVYTFFESARDALQVLSRSPRTRRGR